MYRTLSMFFPYPDEQLLMFSDLSFSFHTEASSTSPIHKSQRSILHKFWQLVATSLDKYPTICYNIIKSLNIASSLLIFRGHWVRLASPSLFLSYN